MLTLKKYQKDVLDTLSEYLRSASQLQDADLAFYQIVRRGYKEVPGLPGLPYVCLRLPTGGGKTLVASHAVVTTASEYLHTETPLVLWLVPSNAIREQTLRALRDRRHAYREALDAGFDGRVTVLDVHEALSVSRSALEGGACIIVSTLAALRRQDKEGLKIYELNGALMDHFAHLPSGIESRLEQASAVVVSSLANVLRLHRPLVIVDEAHNARTPLSFDTLADLQPSCILEFTATPAEDSNVLTHVSAARLKAEAMIKLPIKLVAPGTWEQALAAAIRERETLEQLAVQEQAESGEYLRPIVLVQAQPHSTERDTLTVEVLANSLEKQFKIPKAQIAIATGSQREIEGVNLFDPDCEIRYILTVQALAEGWDCSFAYVLCSVAHIRSSKTVEQILGRVLRLPYARRKSRPELNQAYAFVASEDFLATAEALPDALVENGFERYEAKAAVDAARYTPGPPLPLFAGLEPRSTPAEQGVSFTVPRLTLRVGDQTVLFEATYLPVEWSLAQSDPTLSDEEYTPTQPADQGMAIDVDDREKVKKYFIENVQADLALLEGTVGPAGWDAVALAAWLDRNVAHPDVPQSHSSIFLWHMVDRLIKRRGLTLSQLVHDRFHLRDAAQNKIEGYRNAAKRTGFQRCLMPEMKSQFEVSPLHAWRFEPDQYPANWYYEGQQDFTKHYYRAIGELKEHGEEFRCAVYLDGLNQVKHWVRNVPKYGFWFQTSTDKFYPDFVAELLDGRYLIVEYKGGDIYDTPDSQEKLAIGQLWEERSNGTGVFRMPTRGKFEDIKTAIT